MALNALGAGLGEDLSATTLRRAFRRLARRYHPDRHPESSPAELEHLARLFAEATDHYRVLAAALVTPG
jgi:curved DNA-binding protein CbpA